MATAPVVNSFSIGQECVSKILILPNSQNIDMDLLGHIDEIRGQATISQELVQQGISYQGLSLLRNIYGHITGEIMFTRYNGNVTALIAACFNNFFNSGAESYLQMMLTINNTLTGTQDTMQFTQMVIGSSGLGDFGVKKVEQAIPFRAQRLLVNGGTADFSSLTLANVTSNG